MKPHLSTRQREILRLLIRGKTDKQIAGELSISKRTVRYHISACLHRLNATTREQAVYLFVRRTESL